MSFQVIETKEKLNKDGSLICRTEVFDFGCHHPRHLVKGVLREYPDRFLISLFEGEDNERGFEFSSRSEAVDFIENSLTSKESITQAIIEAEDVFGGELNLEKPSCLGYFDSKFSCKKRSGTVIPAWNLFDKGTGTLLGIIASNIRRTSFHLFLVFKHTTSKREHRQPITASFESNAIPFM